MGQLFCGRKHPLAFKNIKVTVRRGRGTSDLAALKQSIEENWDEIQVQFDNMAEQRNELAQGLNNEKFAADVTFIVQALILDGDKEDFMTEWNFVQDEKLKKFTDLLIEKGGL